MMPCSLMPHLQAAAPTASPATTTAAQSLPQEAAAAGDESPGAPAPEALPSQARGRGGCAGIGDNVCEQKHSLARQFFRLCNHALHPKQEVQRLAGQLERAKRDAASALLHASQLEEAARGKLEHSQRLERSAARHAQHVQRVVTDAAYARAQVGGWWGEFLFLRRKEAGKRPAAPMGPHRHLPADDVQEEEALDRVLQAAAAAAAQSSQRVAQQWEALRGSQEWRELAEQHPEAVQQLAGATASGGGGGGAPGQP